MEAEQNTDDNIAEHRTPFTERRTAFSEQPNKTSEQNTRSANAEQRSLPVLLIVMLSGRLDHMNDIHVQLKYCRAWFVAYVAFDYIRLRSMMALHFMTCLCIVTFQALKNSQCHNAISVFVLHDTVYTQ